MKETAPTRSYELTPERSLYISAQLYSFMVAYKSFLHPQYSIHDLSNSINIPSYQLSAFLNRELGYNFNDYLNRLRIGHCQKLMKSGAVDQLNMHGLAFECGFHNRNSFTTAFKKFTGRTPSDYLKSLSRSGVPPEPDLPSIINTGVYNP